MALLTLLCASALTAAQAEAPAQVTRAQVDDLFRTRCMACHVAPDPRFEVERAWIAQLAHTACGDTPKEARAALIEYLESRPLPLPEVIESARAAGAGDATLLPNFRCGAALLQGPDGRVLRLSWDDPAGERKRVVPAGRYELLGYRLVAESEGTSWHVSASGMRSVTFQFNPGGAHLLAIDPTILIEERAQPDGLQVAVLGHELAGLSLFKMGKRVPLRYRRLDAAGAILAEFELEYGSGGVGRARFEPIEGARAPEIVLDPPPYPVRRARR